MKTLAQISFLSLLLSLDEHQKVLVKNLNEAHAPDTTTTGQLERMAEILFKVNKISFSDSELSVDGVSHY